MSRIRTNLITNRMANGAPTVSNGLVISGVTTVTTLDVNGTFSGDVVFNDGLVTGGQTNPTSSDDGNIYIKNASAVGSVGHQINYVSNAVFNGTWKYINSGTGATRIIVNQNGYQFDAAGSGTAGNNITFNPALNISSAGAHKITCTASHFSANLSEMNTGNLALNIIKSRQGQTKGIGFGAIGSATTSTGIQAYDTSDNSANPLLINPFGGNVGIHDTEPSYKLNVIGDNTAYNGIGMLKGIIGVQNDTTAFGSSPTAGISFQTKYRTGPDVPLDVASIWGGKENATNGDKDGYMGFATREEGGSGSQERMRITSSGHVLFSGLTTKNDPRNANGITLKSAAGVSFQNFGSNGSRNWRIRPDDQSRWGDLDFSVSPTANSATDWPDAASDKVLTLGYDGTVLKPRNPLFVAQKSAAITGTGFVVFNTVIENVGSHYDSSNGRFTAPVAGYYWFCIKINAYKRIDFFLKRNGANSPNTHREIGQFNTSNQDGWYSHNLIRIFELSANDYVQVDVTNITQNSDPGEWITFQGYLLQ